jgi:hypothetical protein
MSHLSKSLKQFDRSIETNRVLANRIYTDELFANTINQPISGITLTSLGGGENLVDGIDVGPTLEVKGLTAGSGIVLTDLTTSIQIDSVSSDVTLTSAGGTESLVTDGTGPSLAIKGLTAGSNVTFTPSGTDLSIAATNDGGGLANVLTAGNTTGGTSISVTVGDQIEFGALTSTDTTGFLRLPRMTSMPSGDTGGNGHIVYENSTSMLYFTASPSTGKWHRIPTAGRFVAGVIDILGISSTKGHTALGLISGKPISTPVAGEGAICWDATNDRLYINSGTNVWNLVPIVDTANEASLVANALTVFSAALPRRLSMTDNTNPAKFTNTTTGMWFGPNAYNASHTIGANCTLVGTSITSTAVWTNATVLGATVTATATSTYTGSVVLGYNTTLAAAAADSGAALNASVIIGTGATGFDRNQICIGYGAGADGSSGTLAGANSICIGNANTDGAGTVVYAGTGCIVIGNNCNTAGDTDCIVISTSSTTPAGSTNANEVLIDATGAGSTQYLGVPGLTSATTATIVYYDVAGSVGNSAPGGFYHGAPPPMAFSSRTVYVDQLAPGPKYNGTTGDPFNNLQAAVDYLVDVAMMTETNPWTVHINGKCGGFKRDGDVKGLILSGNGFFRPKGDGVYGSTVGDIIISGDLGMGSTSKASVWVSQVNCKRLELSGLHCGSISTLSRRPHVHDCIIDDEESYSAPTPSVWVPKPNTYTFGPDGRPLKLEPTNILDGIMVMVLPAKNVELQFPTVEEMYAVDDTACPGRGREFCLIITGKKEDVSLTVKTPVGVQIIGYSHGFPMDTMRFMMRYASPEKIALYRI